MFISPIVISNRVHAGQLLQGCRKTLAEDGNPIRIGPNHGVVIAYRQSLVKAFT
jgi:hypothetical protein